MCVLIRFRGGGGCGRRQWGEAHRQGGALAPALSPFIPGHFHVGRHPDPLQRGMTGTDEVQQTFPQVCIWDLAFLCASVACLPFIHRSLNPRAKVVGVCSYEKLENVTGETAKQCYGGH